MLNINDIKKALYKQKPIAEFNCVVGKTIYYKTKIYTTKRDDAIPVTFNIDFAIPIDEIGDTVFYKEMDGKLLNRYIVIKDTVD